MRSLRLRDRILDGVTRRRSVILGIATILGITSSPSLLTSCSEGTTDGAGEANIVSAKEPSGETPGLPPNSAPEGTPEDDESGEANVSDKEPKLEPPPPAPKPVKAKNLDPSAYYDPPTIDAKPPKTFTRSRSAPDFPNVTLTNQDGEEVKFYDDLVKGKIVVINFMFATCEGT